MLVFSLGTRVQTFIKELKEGVLGTPVRARAPIHLFYRSGTWVALIDCCCLIIATIRASFAELSIQSI